MAMLRKVFRFRLRLTRSQEVAFVKMAGARRFVWNWALARSKEYYQKHRKTIPYGVISAELTALKSKPETAWLREPHAQVLQQALRDQRHAYEAFFRKQANLPKFKSKKNDPLRFRMPQHVRADGDRLYVPKVGWVRFRKSREIDLPTGAATFRRDPSGHWFVTLVAKFEMPDVPLPDVDPDKTVGVDLGLKSIATRSDGVSVAAPRFFRKSERKVKLAQRRLARRKQGSRRRQKAKVAVAKAYQQITNRRVDFLHKLSNGLICEFDCICIENLPLLGLVRTKLSKSFRDAAIGELVRQLKYKSIWNRKTVIQIDRFFPSSKLHGECGFVNKDLTMNDRTWTCQCGVKLDRDLNAAINIRDEGLRMLAVGHTESLNARGDRVRPATAGGDRRTENLADIVQIECQQAVR